MIAWHKYPDEKPPTIGESGLVTITRETDGSVYLETCCYDASIGKFYYDGCDGGGWSRDYISDENITHWICINELPLPLTHHIPIPMPK
ncbi:hypothetical protein [Snodgrassella alvi]|uniref:DUF551 domain-containing protein n=1 Tax=Snodgrassella alvi TaxID=1196083 RepID=A0A2N9XYA2_9NEIS|nr:hypothetical protein [Snodgrassella alvi]PIT55405.1 hypothetical protein BHC49_06440 [Snodgrassella alvi]